MINDKFPARRMQEATPTARSLWKSPASLIVVALFMSLPFETILAGSRDAAFTLSRGIGIALGVAFLLTPRRWRAGNGWALWGFLANLAVVALSAGLSLKAGFADNDGIWQECLTLGQLCMVFWIASSLLQDSDLATSAWRGFYLSCGALAGLNWFGIFRTEEVIFRDRQSALGQDPNYLAGTMAIGLLAIWYDYAALRKRRGTGAGVFSAVTVGVLSIVIGMAIMRSGSRNAVLGVLVGAAIISLSSARKTSKARKVLMVTGLACAGWWAVSQGTILEERFKWLEHSQSSEARYDLYPTAIKMVGERPLFGWGAASARYELGRRMGINAWVDAHNIILGTLIDNGFIGGLPFILAVVICARRASLARRTSRGYLPAAILAAMLTMNMFVSWYYMKLFWLIMAYAWSSGVGLGGSASWRVSGAGSHGQNGPGQ